MSVQLKDLEGVHTLTGLVLGSTQVNGDTVQFVDFTLDGKTYRAQENPDDGWRSYLDDLIELDSEVVPFPGGRVGGYRVNVRHHANYGYEYEDSYEYPSDVITIWNISNNQLILELGTENIDDYYPGCIFAFHPEALGKVGEQ